MGEVVSGWMDGWVLQKEAPREEGLEPQELDACLITVFFFLLVVVIGLSLVREKK